MPTATPEQLAILRPLIEERDQAIRTAEGLALAIDRILSSIRPEGAVALDVATGEWSIPAPEAAATKEP